MTLPRLQPAESAQRSIWREISCIPRGHIATYGQVARRAGLPGRARLVGHALRTAPRKLKLPWHRVVAAGPRITFPKNSPQYFEQRKRLEREGIKFIGARIVVHALQDLDEILWKAP